VLHQHEAALLDGTITIKKVIVHEDAAGRWWATLQCDGVPDQGLPAAAQGRERGVDLGLQPLAVLDDGTQIPAPEFLGRALQQDKPEPGKPRRMSPLKRAQRELSRKIEAQTQRRRQMAAAGNPRPPQSKRLARAQLRVAKLHARIADGRKDFAHKLSHGLVYGGEVAPGVRLEGAERIAIEKIGVANMVRRSADPEIRDPAGLNRRDLDAGWGQILQLAQGKAAAAGALVVPVPAQRDQKAGGRQASARQILAAGQAVWSAPDEKKKSSPRSKQGGRRQGMPSLDASSRSPRAGDEDSTQAGRPPRAEGIGSTTRGNPGASVPVEASTTDILYEHRGDAHGAPSLSSSAERPDRGVLAKEPPKPRRSRGSA